MLKVKSFEMMDSDGINALLTKYRIASGAHILVSEGKVCIPYEDGEKPTRDQEIVSILEQRNGLLAELNLLVHSIKVNDMQIKDVEQALAIAESVYNVAPNDKEQEKEYNRIKGTLAEMMNLRARNNAEEKRLRTNIELFEESAK